MKYLRNILSAPHRKEGNSGKAIANYMILNQLANATDGMETSKRRDCDKDISDIPN